MLLGHTVAATAAVTGASERAGLSMGAWEATALDNMAQAASRTGEGGSSSEGRLPAAFGALQSAPARGSASQGGRGTARNTL